MERNQLQKGTDDSVAEDRALLAGLRQEELAAEARSRLRRLGRDELVEACVLLGRLGGKATAASPSRAKSTAGSCASNSRLLRDSADEISRVRPYPRVRRDSAEEAMPQKPKDMKLWLRYELVGEKSGGAGDSAVDSTSGTVFGTATESPRDEFNDNCRCSCSLGQQLRLEPTVGFVASIHNDVATTAGGSASFSVSRTLSSDSAASLLELVAAVSEPGRRSNPWGGRTSEVLEDRQRLRNLWSSADPFFSITPALPDGVSLDPRSGVIYGAPEVPCDETTYAISMTTSTRVRVTLQVTEEVLVPIDEDFASRIEEIKDVADILPEPPRNLAFGDWMIWMVHRAWLDDPALTEIDFTSMHMPPPHVEPRIAPKLMAAMSWNSHLQVMCLPNSNLQQAQGSELAKALLVNCTVRIVNLESNFLDSGSVKELANAIRENRKSRIEYLNVAHQRKVGKFFGRPTEEALGQMMQKNETIVKLIVECDDAHWRNIIDRSLLRNNDFRRKRPSQVLETDTGPVAERPLGSLNFRGKPAPVSNGTAVDDVRPGGAFQLPTEGGHPAAGDAGVRGVRGVTKPTVGAAAFGNTGSSSWPTSPITPEVQGLSPASAPPPTPVGEAKAPREILREYIIRCLRIPTVPQLQSFLKNACFPAVPYSVAAPLIMNYRTRLLDAAVQTEVVATDAFGTNVTGILRSWSESNGSWTFDVNTSEGTRYIFKSEQKVPAFSVSSDWAKWLPNQQ
eukprot:TRINITY_DN10023_c0_g1_i2.p1 TRINITY_DN10023_c0_g1~~TRINITY_DN10023_c0_g1_i2.p1  ORF type:complete len:736 (+),score=109.14 TRINITY_DN10023_c0_g1_i2:143-2350(+)